MTIFDFDNLPTITIPYIIRDLDNQAVSVSVTNQETKETVSLAALTDALFYENYFTIDVTSLLTGITANTTLLVSAIDSNGSPVYRDIVVFEQRMDVDADYEQNDETGEYIFA